MNRCSPIVLTLCLLLGGTVSAMPLIPRTQPGQLPLGAPGGFAAPGRSVPGENAHGLNANDAARQAQSLNGGGRVLSVEESRDGWRVKLLKEGNVRIVFVPD